MTASRVRKQFADRLRAWAERLDPQPRVGYAGAGGAGGQVRLETFPDGTRGIVYRGGGGGRGVGLVTGHDGSGASTTVNPSLFDPRSGGDGGPVDAAIAMRAFAEKGWPYEEGENPSVATDE